MRCAGGRLAALGWVACTAWTACTGGGQPQDSGATLPPTNAAEAGLASSDGAAGLGPRLTVTHPGWKRAQCQDCHAQADLLVGHGGVVRVPPTCVSCHGYNGAPHADHAADPAGLCGECHSSGAVVSDHLTDYLLPQDCVTCHVHPQNREGS